VYDNAIVLEDWRWEELAYDFYQIVDFRVSNLELSVSVRTKIGTR
jgi:hypothetical protein